METTDEPQVFVPVEIREMTRIETDKGNIHVIHEITLGDMLTCLLIAALVIFTFIGRVVRR